MRLLGASHTGADMIPWRASVLKADTSEACESITTAFCVVRKLETVAVDHIVSRILFCSSLRARARVGCGREPCEKRCCGENGRQSGIGEGARGRGGGEIERSCKERTIKELDKRKQSEEKKAS